MRTQQADPANRRRGGRSFKPPMAMASPTTAEPPSASRTLTVTVITRLSNCDHFSFCKSQLESAAAHRFPCSSPLPVLSTATARHCSAPSASDISTMSSDEEGAAAPACPACRGAHRAHTCGRARPRNVSKRKRRPLSEIQLEFDHPGVRMKRGQCNKCVDKDREIERLKKELAGAQEDAALYRRWWSELVEPRLQVRRQSVCSLWLVLCPLSCVVCCC